MSRNRDDATHDGRRRTVTDAVASPHLAELSLAELRSYRRRLGAEEDRVSYWRRLVHARIDLLDAQSHTDGSLGMEELVRVLGDTGSGHTRNALVRVRASEPLPDLPVLSEMWLTGIDPDREEDVAEALARLGTAERKLTGYRRALHARIDEATGELISRYRQDPARALVALPGA